MNANPALLQKVIRTSEGSVGYVGLIRHDEKTAQAAKIRSLLRGLGLLGISVKSGPGPYIKIALPDAVGETPEHVTLHDQLWQANLPHSDCPDCALKQKARHALEKIILAAFPDLGDRSEYQSDYFDFVFAIH